MKISHQIKFILLFKLKNISFKFNENMIYIITNGLYETILDYCLQPKYFHKIYLLKLF